MSDLHTAQVSVDVLIIGSGPIGAAFARVIAERAPHAKMLMVDVGPQLTARPGMHVKNIPSAEERTRAQIRSQGPSQYQYKIPTIAERSAAAERSGPQRVATLARPGTHLATTDDADLERSGMPAAALSSNVGGMGAHWTCACPPPGNTERIGFIPEDEWERLFRKAHELLAVTVHAYPESVEGFAIQQTLGEVFDAVLPEGRKVQRMPLACRSDADGRRLWTGSDVILGPLADAAGTGHNFELRPETLCRKVLADGSRATGALVEHLPTGRQEVIAAKVVVVAADSLRTPQLLWASGIRPQALGHYLNDQPQIVAGVELSEEILERARSTLAASGQLPSTRREAGESVAGVFWVPFHDPEHPFHGQVMQLDASPIPLDISEAQADPRYVVGLGWFCRKELRFEDHVAFSDSETDYLGMPKMQIHYELTPADHETIDAARREQARAALAFGRMLREDESRLIPAGSSLHYQGTVRMGETADGRSVCDPYSRVWGFQNLFVGGNGVIPTATACNPTPTSVALAVRACEQIVALLE